MADKPDDQRKLVQKQISGLDPLLTLLSPFSRKAREGKAQIKEIKVEIQRLQDIQSGFTARYSPLGWAMFGKMSATVMGEALELEVNEGDAHLTRYHLDFQTLRFNGQRFKQDSYRPWYELYERAVERAVAEDYVSCVPLVLMITDGLIKRSTGRHGFSGGTDTPVFDSIAAEAGGIADTLSLMSVPRDRVNNVPLALPYRHGIIHGADVNYGHAIVAAKAFNALHAAVEYCDNAATEADRMANAVDQQRVRSLKEIAEQNQTIKKMKQGVREWEARPPMLLGEGVGPDNVGGFEPNSPEATAAEYLSALTGRTNYGFIADRTVDNQKRHKQQQVKIFRAHLDGVITGSWSILSFKDEAPAISEVAAHVWGGSDENPWNYKGWMRLVYQSKDGRPAVRGDEGGQWRVIEHFLTHMAAAGALGKDVDHLN